MLKMFLGAELRDQKLRLGDFLKPRSKAPLKKLRSLSLRRKSGQL